MELNYNFFIGFIVGIILLVIIYTITNNLSKPECFDLHNAIQILVRQAARWSTAAKQDKSPLIAVLHANYGVGYLIALRDIATDSQIKDATGINPKKFERAIVNVQDEATKKMIKVCPDYAPPKSYLTKIGGEG